MTTTMMPSPSFLPFALPEIGEEEIAEVVDTLRSGWITTGPKAQRFERDFAAFLGERRVQRRGQLRDRRPAPGARGARHRAGRRGHHDDPHLHRDRRGRALPRRRRRCSSTSTRRRCASTRTRSRRRSRRARRRSCRCTTPASPPTCRDPRHRPAARPQGRRGRRARAAAPPAAAASSARSDSDATVFSFYANKTITTGEGGMVVTRDRRARASARA